MDKLKELYAGFMVQLCRLSCELGFCENLKLPNNVLLILFLILICTVMHLKKGQIMVWKIRLNLKIKNVTNITLLNIITIKNRGTQPYLYAKQSIKYFFYY